MLSARLIFHTGWWCSCLVKLRCKFSNISTPCHNDLRVINTLDNCLEVNNNSYWSVIARQIDRFIRLKRRMETRKIYFLPSFVDIKKVLDCKPLHFLIKHNTKYINRQYLNSVHLNLYLYLLLCNFFLNFFLLSFFGKL